MPQGVRADQGCVREGEVATRMVLRQSTIFTAHAFERVKERLSLTHEEVAAILDQGLAVNVGIDPFSNRLRRVFFSAPDRTFFVAVQDVSDGALVTVLPLEFHANLRYAIHERYLVEAAANMGCPPPDLRHLVGVKLRGPVTAVRISCSIAGDDDAPMFKSLGSWPAADAPGDIGLLARDPGFLREIRARAESKGIDPGAIKILHLRLGNAGERVDVGVDLSFLSEPPKQSPGERDDGLEPDLTNSRGAS